MVSYCPNPVGFPQTLLMLSFQVICNRMLRTLHFARHNHPNAAPQQGNLVAGSIRSSISKRKWDFAGDTRQTREPVGGQGLWSCAKA